MPPTSLSAPGVGVHPEMVSERPEKPERKQSAKVQEVIDLTLLQDS